MSSNLLKLLCFLFTAIFSLCEVYAQTRYKKNDHVDIACKINQGFYEIDYSFKDHFDNIQDFKISYPVLLIDSLTSRFGIPFWLLNNYDVNDESIALRDSLIEQGFFIKNGESLVVDKSAIVNYYAQIIGKPIADYIIKTLRDSYTDTRYNRIEFAMKFIQDIPYGVPDNNKTKKHNCGFFTPPHVLIKGFGDCDSKTVLFVSILVYLIDPSEIYFLGQTGHILTGIKDISLKGRLGVKYNDKTIIVAETAGPGRPRFGQKKEIKEKTAKISKLDFKCEPINTPVLNEDNIDVIKDLYLNYYKVFFENDYKKPIKLLVNYKDLNGQWQKSGFHTINPGVAINLVKTRNKNLYYYAISDHKRWEGDMNFNFEGKSYRFKKHRINGSYFHREVIEITD